MCLQVTTGEAVDVARQLALKEGLLVRNCTTNKLVFSYRLSFLFMGKFASNSANLDP
jgi:hypothetical protein